MTLAKIGGKYYTVPTEWNELSQSQLLQIMEVLFVRQYAGTAGMLKLLKILAGMSTWEFLVAKPADLQEFYYLTLFILKDRTDLTKQIIPEYKGLYGPADDFDNLVMKELVFAEDYFLRWSENREDLKTLDDLCSVLYRPAKARYDHKRNPDGDPREDFNQNVCAWRSTHEIKKWPISVKLAIATWYDACRWNLVDQNEEVFGGEGGDVAKYGLISLMMSVAETQVLGNFDSVENKNVKLVMIQLNESISKAKAQERAMKQA